MLKNGVVVTAIQQQTLETFQRTDVNELTNLMSNLCASISNKVSELEVHPSQLVQVWMEVVPLGFTNNLKSIHSCCKILCKTINEDTAILLEDPNNSFLLNRLVLMLQYQTFELLHLDSLIFNSIIDLLQILCMVPQFARLFRTPLVMTRIMQLPKEPNIEAQAKAKLVKIIRSLSNAEQTQSSEYTMPMPSDV